MKKLAFMLAVVFLSVAAFGQQKQTTPSSSKSKSDSTMVHKKSGTNGKWDKNKTGKKDMTKAKKDTTKTKKY